MRTRIKICGLSTVETALTAAAAGADAIGLVFVDKSPRVVTMRQARTIIDALPAFVQPVGLFVDRPIEQVLETAGELGLTTVQLHGCETPQDVAELTHLRVIKALSFADAEQARRAIEPWMQAPANVCGLLFDAQPDPDANIPGGSGKTFNWSDLAQLWNDIDSQMLPPLILAGGLNAQNVAEAIATVKPYAVDVSSGVEASRGVKDATRIAAFCRAVRQAGM